MTGTGALAGTALTRARARWYLLRFGGPLALVPSLLQPVVAVAVAVALALVVRHPWPLVLPAAWLALPLLWRPKDDALQVTASDEPELWRLVGAVAGALGAPLPHHLALDASPNASFRHAGRTRRTELRLGVPLLVTLDRAAVEAVVAHELAHAVQLDHRRGFGDAGLLERLVQTRQRVVAQRALRRRPGSAAHGGLAARFLWDTQALARALETDADRAAVAVVGAGTLAAALRSADRADAALALYRGFVVEPMLAGGVRPPAVLEGFTRWVAHVDEHVLDRIAGWHDADPAGHYDDHPLDDERTPAELDGAVSRHPAAQHREPPAVPPPVTLRSGDGAERLLAAALLGRHAGLPAGTNAVDGEAVLAWRTGATRVRLALLRTGRLGRRIPSLGEAVARRTAPGHAPNDSAGLVSLLVSLAVSFAVELGDRGWLGPLPGTSVLISPAETYDDALELALAALDEESIAPLADALRAGRPRLTSA
jgi:Zn-dependent protease with chaperone function